MRASISAIEGFLLPQNLLGFDVFSTSLLTIVGDEAAVDLGLDISVSLLLGWYRSLMASLRLVIPFANINALNSPTAVVLKKE